jgi:hypothetical protein
MLIREGGEKGIEGDGNWGGEERRNKELDRC